MPKAPLDDIVNGADVSSLLLQMPELPKALESIAYALHRLGHADAATPMGAIEDLSAQIKEGAQAIAGALYAIAEAIDRQD